MSTLQKISEYAGDTTAAERMGIMNANLIKELKHVKKAIVATQMIGDDWEEQQTAVRHLEEVVTYLNDSEARGVDFEESMPPFPNLQAKKE